MNSFLKEKESYLECISEFIGGIIPMKLRDIDDILDNLFKQIKQIQVPDPVFRSSRYGYDQTTIFSYHEKNNTLEYGDRIYEILDAFKLNDTKRGDRLVIKMANRYFNLSKIKRVTNSKIFWSTRTINVAQRRIRAQWTPVLDADIQTYQNIHVEEELAGYIRSAMAQEIDREILNELRNVNS